MCYKLNTKVLLYIIIGNYIFYILIYSVCHVFHFKMEQAEQHLINDIKILCLHSIFTGKPSVKMPNFTATNYIT
jgi:hypothetical protein